MPTFTDDFSYSGLLADHGWSPYNASASANGNNATFSSATAMRHSTDMGAGDHSASFVAGTGNYPYNHIYVGVKLSSDALSGYFAGLSYNSGNMMLEIRRCDSGTWTHLAWGAAAHNTGGPFTIALSYVAGELTATYEGGDETTATDTTYDENLYCGYANSTQYEYIDTFSAETPIVRTLTVEPDPVWVGGGIVEMTATGGDTEWTPGTPGSSEITVDHGTILGQWTETATLIHFVLDPAEYVGTLTFTESEYSLQDTVTATLDPDAGGEGGECKLTDDGAQLVNDTAAEYLPGHILTDSHVVILSPVMNVQDALAYLITLVRNLYNPAPDWPDGEPAPDTRLDVLWDWLSGGAELQGLPQTPNTSTPIKVDTERIYAFLKAGANDYGDLSDIVALLGGSPVVLSHQDLKTAIDLIDWPAILTRLDDIQPNHLISLTDIAGLINNLTSGGAYGLTDVLTAIANLNPATAPGLTAATASILGAIGALALEIAGVAAAETEDAAASTAAAAGVAGLVAEIAGLAASIASILQSLAEIKATIGAQAYHPPIWPGVAHVTMGAPQDLQGSLVVPGPMHGVCVDITSTDPGTAYFDYDVVRCWRNVGALSFVSDRGDHEQFQPLGFQRGIYVPKTMTYAASCKLHLGRGPKGTITPWSYAT